MSDGSVCLREGGTASRGSPFEHIAERLHPLGFRSPLGWCSATPTQHRQTKAAPSPPPAPLSNSPSFSVFALRSTKPVTAALAKPRTRGSPPRTFEAHARTRTHARTAAMSLSFPLLAMREIGTCWVSSTSASPTRPPTRRMEGQADLRGADRPAAREQAEDFQQRAFNGLQQLDFPELHEEAITVMAFFRACHKLLSISGSDFR